MLFCVVVFGSVKLVKKNFKIFLLSVCQVVSSCCRVVSMSQIHWGCLGWLQVLLGLFHVVLCGFRWWEVDSFGFGCLSFFWLF